MCVNLIIFLYLRRYAIKMRRGKIMLKENHNNVYANEDDDDDDDVKEEKVINIISKMTLTLKMKF